MKAALLYLTAYPCLAPARLGVSSIMSYQSFPLWPAALCHLISSTRASCDHINKSLSLLDAIEILMVDHPKAGTWNRGEKEGWKGGKKKRSFASPLAGLNFLICVSTLP